MKILIIRNYPNHLDIRNYNSQEVGLARAMIRAGNQCDIVYYNGWNRTRKELIAADSSGDRFITLFWLRALSVLNNSLFIGLGKIVRNYDIIHVAEYDQLNSWLLYTFPRGRKIYIYHGPYDSDISARHNLKCRVFDKFLLHRFNTARQTVFTKSELASESIRKRGFGKVVTVGVGIDFQRFSQNQEMNGFCTKLANEKGENYYLLYVGVIEERRNIPFLFDVLKKVACHKPNVKLVLVGKGKDTYMEYCFTHARQIGVWDHIVYKDAMPQAELSQLYSICDLFILPTKFEIFGMVLLEAMYFGLPVVTSYNGGSSTLIPDERYGRIVRAFDADEWSEAINRLLDMPEERMEIGRMSSHFITEMYSWDKIAQKFLENY